MQVLGNTARQTSYGIGSTRSIGNNQEGLYQNSRQYKNVATGNADRSEMYRNDTRRQLDHQREEYGLDSRGRPSRQANQANDDNGNDDHDLTKKERRQMARRERIAERQEKLIAKEHALEEKRLSGHATVFDRMTEKRLEDQIHHQQNRIDRLNGRLADVDADQNYQAGLSSGPQQRDPFLQKNRADGAQMDTYQEQQLFAEALVKASMAPADQKNRFLSEAQGHLSNLIDSNGEISMPGGPVNVQVGRQTVTLPFKEPTHYANPEAAMNNVLGELQRQRVGTAPSKGSVAGVVQANAQDWDAARRAATGAAPAGQTTLPSAGGASPAAEDVAMDFPTASGDLAAGTRSTRGVVPKMTKNQVAWLQEKLAQQDTELAQALNAQPNGPGSFGPLTMKALTARTGLSREQVGALDFSNGIPQEIVAKLGNTQVNVPVVDPINTPSTYDQTLVQQTQVTTDFLNSARTFFTDNKLYTPKTGTNTEFVTTVENVYKRDNSAIIERDGKYSVSELMLTAAKLERLKKANVALPKDLTDNLEAMLQQEGITRTADGKFTNGKTTVSYSDAVATSPAPAATPEIKDSPAKMAFLDAYRAHAKFTGTNPEFVQFLEKESKQYPAVRADGKLDANELKLIASQLNDLGTAVPADLKAKLNTLMAQEKAALDATVAASAPNAQPQANASRRAILSDTEAAVAELAATYRPDKGQGQNTVQRWSALEKDLASKGFDQNGVMDTAELAYIAQMTPKGKFPAVDKLVKQELTDQGVAVTRRGETPPAPAQPVAPTASPDAIQNTELKHNFLVALASKIGFSGTDAQISAKIESTAKSFGMTMNGNGDLERNELITIANNSLAKEALTKEPEVKDALNKLLAAEGIKKIDGVYTDGQTIAQGDQQRGSGGTGQANGAEGRAQ